MKVGVTAMPTPSSIAGRSPWVLSSLMVSIFNYLYCTPQCNKMASLRRIKAQHGSTKRRLRYRVYSVDLILADVFFITIRSAVMWQCRTYNITEDPVVMKNRLVRYEDGIASKLGLLFIVYCSLISSSGGSDDTNSTILRIKLVSLMYGITST